jgi:hypothetical protein
MPIARSNQRLTAQNHVTVLGLLHRDLAAIIQPPGKGPRKQFRHVLHNHNARSIGR